MHSELFLDELSEFERHIPELLREPLGRGCITITRATHHTDFRAQFQSLAAMNPCPCGYLGHYNGKCRCTPDQIARYRGKISGSLLDRIDIQTEVPAVPQETLLKQTVGDTNSDIQARVSVARQRALWDSGDD